MLRAQRRNTQHSVLSWDDAAVALVCSGSPSARVLVFFAHVNSYVFRLISPFIMAPKRKRDNSDGKKRKAITMETKLDIIKRSDKGENPTNIGRSLGYRRCTVATVISLSHSFYTIGIR